jgi:hypothetical protein
LFGTLSIFKGLFENSKVLLVLCWNSVLAGNWNVLTFVRELLAEYYYGLPLAGLLHDKQGRPMRERTLSI